MSTGLPAPLPAKDVFRRHGLRCTRQRAVIYDALRATQAHPTADELLGFVRSAEPGLSLATVYNTLEVLAEHGLVHRIASPRGNGPSRYDADLGRHLHVTLPDGRVLDLPDEIAESILDAIPADLSQRLSALLGEEVGPVHVELSVAPARQGTSR